jgi:site-specific recombinase XerD
MSLSSSIFPAPQREIISLVNTGARAQVYSNPAEAYLASLGSDASRKTMLSVLSKIAQHFGFDHPDHVPWELLNDQPVISLLGVLVQKNYSKQTVALYLAAVRGVAHRAWRMQLIDANAFESIKDIKARGETRLPKGKAVPPREMKLLLAACTADARMQGPRDAAIIWTLYAGGLRRSELVKLDMNDLIPEDGALLVQGKGNKQRQIYLNDDAWDCLMAWIDTVRGDHPGPLFTRIRKNDDITDNRLSAKAVYFLLEQRCIETGIEIARPHDMRRSFISRLLELGEDIATVQSMAGHASINTTQRYDRRGEARKKSAANRLRLDDR